MKKRITLGLIAFQMIAFNAIATIEINFDTDAYGNPFTAPRAFEDTIRLSELYAPLGVHFFGPPGNKGKDGGAILNQDSNFGVNAHSGINFLAFNPQAYLADHGRPQGPETITFDTLVSNVSIFAAGGFIAKTFLMEGFDANGILVASDTITTQEFAELEITWALGIRSVKVSMTTTGTTGAFVLDDLSADFVPEPSTISLLICAAGLGFALRLRKKKL